MILLIQMKKISWILLKKYKSGMFFEEFCVMMRFIKYKILLFFLKKYSICIYLHSNYE